MRFYPALKAVVFLIAGITAAYWWDLPPFLWAGLTGGFLSVAILLRPGWLRFIILVLSLFCGGGWLWSSAPSANDFKPFPLRVGGVITEPPAQYSSWTAFPLTIDTVFTSSHPPQALTLKVWCRIPDESIKLRSGQRIELDGLLQPLEPRRNPGDFDLQSWRERNGYHAVFQTKKDSRLSITPRAPSLIFRIRNDLMNRIDRHYGEAAPLMQAVLLGYRREMDPEFNEALRMTGLAHLVALSGMNVAFLMALLVGLGSVLRLGYRGRIALGLFALLLFLVLVPPRASTMRAAVMAFLFLVAPLLRRCSPAGNTLAFSAMVLLITRPGDLFDIGFQLSYAAVGGILLFHRDIDRYLHWRATRDGAARRFINRWLIAGLGVSLGATALVMPLASRHFNIMTPGVVVFNLTAIPLMQVVYTVGCLAMMVSYLSNWCSGLLAEASAFPLYALEASTRFFAQISPVINIRLAPLTVGLMLSAAAWAAVSRRPLQVRYATAVMALVCLLTLDNLRPLPLRPQSWFLDVGQGDAALLLFPDANTVVIDAGPPLMKAQDSPLITALNRYERRRVDLLIASHLEADHIGGMESLLQRFPVSEAVTCAKLPDSKIYHRLMELSDEKGLTWRNATRGDTVDGIAPGFQGYVLNPPTASTWSANNQSLVVLFDFTDSDDIRDRLLFTGDVEKTAEADLASGMDVEAAVLKAPHHGNLTSSSEAFLDAVNPDYAVISSGRRYESFMRKNQVRYLDRGIETHATLDEGAALFEASKSEEGWRWEPVAWRKPSFRRWLMGWD